jgi:uncharacterized alkaline shock family protein YloU
MTTTEAQTKATTAETGAVTSRDRAPAVTGPGNRHAELVTPQGKTSISDAVVRKIAGVATREVAGVHDLGTGGARAFGSVRARIPGSSGPNVARGVSVEVGERQAAVDLDVVCDYGVSIVDLSQAVRRNVISSVEGMTGLEVTEVNIAVDDVFIAGEEEAERRVE